jgi:hypothetical protein
MGKLCPSQSEIKKMLENLQRRKTEISTIDAKLTLNLKEDGDCASFIRHIAALANTGQKGYIFIGVEDKTWIPKGIPEDSPLLMVDSTQQQMNQILATRLDPPITVVYCTYDIDGIIIGLIGVESTNPPYIISISDPKFGGAKTKGRESNIYRGIIYIRRGTDSVPANRRSEILEILNGKRDYVEIVISLVFIGMLVAIGIGVGSTLIRFGDLPTPIILGCIWGLVIGWLVNKRLADAFGRFPDGKLGKIIKNTGGLLWGGVIGAYLSYTIVGNILNGKTKPLDPISMGLFIAPLLAILFTLPIIGFAYIVYEIYIYTKKGRR